MKRIFITAILLVLSVFGITGLVNAQTTTTSPTPSATTTVMPTNTTTPSPTGSVQGTSVTVPSGAPATGHAQ